MDDHYVLASFRACVKAAEDDYVFLYDAGQQALFLGQATQPVDVAAFWRKHQQDDSYCISCELMFCFDYQWVAAPEYPPVEMGVDNTTAHRLLQSLRATLGDRIPTLAEIGVIV
jgi:hypothetical protein